MSTLAIISISVLGAGILLVLASVLLKARLKQPYKISKAIRAVGGILCTLSLLGLPFLAATNQLFSTTALDPTWPHSGYIESVANSNEDVYSGDFKDGLYHGFGVLHITDR
jgi:hypothetical protein